MTKKTCYLFVFDGFADWEPSLLTTGLKQYTDVDLKTFSIDGKPVRSMGNLKIVPDGGLKDVSPEATSALVLPGGTAWELGGNMEIIPLLDKVIEENGLVAAICGATIFLGQHGYLNAIKHTSNHIYFLKQSGGNYKGEDWYVSKPCVSDKNIITANGTAMVDFATAVFAELNVLEGNKALNSWLQFFPKSTMPEVSIEDFVIDSTPLK